MLNFNRNDRLPDPKDTKVPARPNTPLPGAAPMPSAAPPATPPRAATPQPAASSAPVPSVEPTPAPVAASAVSDTQGSRLSIGPNINLKGVEISNCDVLVIEGIVDATITSKVMEVGQPGRFTGTAVIDVAEIHGDFSGELTARTKLVVHGTGRVTGTIRYGKLVVEEGGTLTGELKQLEAANTGAPAQSGSQPAQSSPTMPRPLLNPQPH